MSRKRTHIKGHCQSCEFREQHTLVEDSPGGQRITVVDTFCGLFDVFVPLDGFCHCFEPKIEEPDVA